MQQLTFFLLVFSFLHLLPVSGQNSGGIPPTRPKLVVYIVVEQMRYDYIDRFWDKLSEDGFKRLVREGAWCRDASYFSANNQTASSHATLATGTYPENHGIIANSWFHKLENKLVPAVGDEREATIGGSFDSGKASPRQLLATTIADQLRLSNRQFSKSFAVALHAAPAILTAGQMANGAFWMDRQTGNWVTSSFYQSTEIPWVTSYNEQKIAASHLGRTWSSKYPAHTYMSSLPDLNPYEKGLSGRTIFPYVLPELTQNKTAEEKHTLLQATPFGNTMVKDMAITLMSHENLGKGSFTDFLGITFGATEDIGTLFGPNSIEVEDAFLWLDEDLAHLLQFIDDFTGINNTLIVLTSSHGAAIPPAYLNDQGSTAGYFNATSALSLLRSYLNALYGPGEWITAYQNQQIYLNSVLIGNSGRSEAEITRSIVGFLSQISGIASIITGETLQTSTFTDAVSGRVQNSYHIKRSGDIFLNLLPGWIEKSDYVTSSNSPYPYDTRVPLLWFGWNIRPQTIYTPVDITDIPVTTAEMLRIAPPNAATGKIIRDLLP